MKISDNIMEYWLKWLNDVNILYFSCTSYDAYVIICRVLTVYLIMANNSDKD